MLEWPRSAFTPPPGRPTLPSDFSPVDFAVIYAGLGDADEAFLRLEEAYQSRSPRIHELTFGYFDRIRSDARYPELLRRVGLPV